MKQFFAVLAVTLIFFSCTSIGTSLTSSKSDSAESSVVSQNNKNQQTDIGSNSTFTTSSRVETPKATTAQDVPERTDAELVDEAIRWGNCAFLYEFTKKEGIEDNLVKQANNTIKRYTSIERNTAKYRTGKMEAKVRRIPENLINNVFVYPETALPSVVEYLSGGVSDQFLKVKILHDWICDNITYDTDRYFSGKSNAQDYISVLKRKKGVCAGYTNLMNEMCRLAGIESIGINGYSKGFGYRGKIGANTDHAWNAVHIGNKWYLIDVTWDAGYVDRKTYIKRYSSEWLFLGSREFLYSHLPGEEAYQYYAPVLTVDDFMHEPYIPGKFFHYGLSLETRNLEYNNFLDGAMTVDIKMDQSDVLLSSGLRTTNQLNVDGASWLTRKGLIVSFDFDVPDNNEYEGHIFAKYINEENPKNRVTISVYEDEWLPKAYMLFNTENPKDKKITEEEYKYFENSYFKVPNNGYYYFLEDQFDFARNKAVLKIHRLLGIATDFLESVLSFNIKAVSGYPGFGKGVLKYPYIYSNYMQLSNTRLVSPLTGTVKAGSKETFVIFSSNYSSFAIIIDKKWNYFTRNTKTGYSELTLTIPDNIDSINIFGAKSKTSQHWGLVKFNVVQ